MTSRIRIASGLSSRTCLSGKENNESNKHHDNEHESPMNVSKGVGGSAGLPTTRGLEEWIR